MRGRAVYGFAMPLLPPSDAASIPQRAVWRIVLLYGVFAALWIWSSDALLAWAVPDAAAMTQLSMAKGWLFVALTAALLYGLIARLVAQANASLHALRAREAELQAAHRQLQQAQDIAGLGQYELDVGTGLWTASPIAERLLGIDASRPLALSAWEQLILPEDLPTLSAYMQGVLATGSVFLHTYRIVRANDGAVRWVQARGEVTRDAQGQALRLAGTFQDVSEIKAAEQQLAASEQRLQATLDALPDLLFEVGLDGRIHHYHSHRSDLLAAPPEAFLGKRFDEVLPTEPAQVCRLAIDEADRQGFSAGHRYALDLPQGRRWFDLSVAPLTVSLGNERRFIFIARDVTERHTAEDKLQLAGRVFQHAREAIMVTGPDGNIVDINDAFTHITGYTRDDALGRNPRFLSSGRQSDEYYRAMWKSLNETGAWSGEIWNRRKDGEVYAEMLTISAVRGPLGDLQHYVALFSDITALKKYQDELEHIAHYDVLTNLPNRLLLADRLQQALTQATRRGKTVAIAYLDLDGFKAVNDRHGHAVGDKLLITLAHRMQDVLRTGDTLARIGGDEFVAVLIDLDQPSAAAPLLARMLRVAAEEFQVAGLSLHVSASIGVTYFPQAQPVAPDQLLRQADQAMYQAKLSGKNRHAEFDERQDSSARQHHASLQRIREALQRDEFVLHFQPKVNMRSGTVIGAEALIRWQHPDQGLLPPGLFLPQLEGDGLAVDLGDWVIRSALAQHERWLDVGLCVPVSVNVSALHLQQPQFAEHLQAHLRAHPRAAPEHLTLEILETSALHDLAQAALVIDACKALGVAFELDDFGTGYSSLTYLRQLDVTGIKIDQSFVRDMLGSPDDQAILRGILGLADAFGIAVIAEGVETVAHGAQLLALGCEAAQGYGIARPMPAEAFVPWAQTWRPDAAWAADQGPASTV